MAEVLCGSILSGIVRLNVLMWHLWWSLTKDLYLGEVCAWVTTGARLVSHSHSVFFNIWHQKETATVSGPGNEFVSCNCCCYGYSLITCGLVCAPFKCLSKRLCFEQDTQQVVLTQMHNWPDRNSQRVCDVFRCCHVNRKPEQWTVKSAGIHLLLYTHFHWELATADQNIISIQLNKIESI